MQAEMKRTLSLEGLRVLLMILLTDESLLTSWNVDRDIGGRFPCYVEGNNRISIGAGFWYNVGMCAGIGVKFRHLKPATVNAIAVFIVSGINPGKLYLTNTGSAGVRRCQINRMRWWIKRSAIHPGDDV